MKKVTRFLATVLSTALLCTVLAFSFAGCTAPQLEEEKMVEESADNLVVGENVSMSKRKLLQKEYTSEGISPLAESAYQLTATVLPIDATDRTLDWTIEFVNATSQWASGKTVTQYVTLTPTSDGAHTANVSCLQAFGEQIKVVATSRSNPSCKAEVLLDYCKRLSDSAAVVDVSSMSFYTADSIETLENPGDNAVEIAVTTYNSEHKAYSLDFSQFGRLQIIGDHTNYSNFVFCPLFSFNLNDVVGTLVEEYKDYSLRLTFENWNLSLAWGTYTDDDFPSAYTAHSAFLYAGYDLGTSERDELVTVCREGPGFATFELKFVGSITKEVYSVSLPVNRFMFVNLYEMICTDVSSITMNTTSLTF